MKNTVGFGKQETTEMMETPFFHKFTGKNHLTTLIYFCVPWPFLHRCRALWQFLGRTSVFFAFFVSKQVWFYSMIEINLEGLGHGWQEKDDEPDGQRGWCHFVSFLRRKFHFSRWETVRHVAFMLPEQSEGRCFLQHLSWAIQLW